MELGTALGPVAVCDVAGKAGGLTHPTRPRVSATRKQILCLWHKVPTFSCSSRSEAVSTTTWVDLMISRASPPPPAKG